MSDELIKAVQDLIDFGKGDHGRLEYILETLKKGKALFSSDQDYLDTLLTQSDVINEKSFEIIESTKTERSGTIKFCSNCGNSIQTSHTFCSKCGKIVNEEKYEEKLETSNDTRIKSKRRSPLWYLLPFYFNIIGGLISYFIIKKEDKRKARNCLLLGLSLFVIPTAVMLGLRVISSTDNPFYVVSTGSMEPNLNVFDVLVVQGNDPFDKIQTGDIIVFNRPTGHDRVIVHRVAEILDEDPRVVRTKGDANPASIPGTDFPITKDEYIGKVVYVIPQIGYITRILTPPINYIVLPIVLILPIVVAVIAHVEYKKS